MWFERLAARPVPPAWLGFATSQFDVAIISLGFVSFILAGRPIVASNSLVHYTMYFVALAGTGLRYDPRVCLAAGGAALLQYGAIVTWVGLREPSVWTVEPIYGTFQWDSQVEPAAAHRRGHDHPRRRGGAVAGLLARLDARPAHRALQPRLLRRELRPPGRRPAPARRPFTVAIIDLDDFKAVNDRYGHAAGDEALRFAAGRLREAFRDDDIIARYGGEEFAVLLQADRATAVARLDAWRAALHADARIPRLSASVGVASMPEDGSTRGAARRRRSPAVRRQGRRPQSHRRRRITRPRDG